MSWRTERGLMLVEIKLSRIMVKQRKAKRVVDRMMTPTVANREFQF